MKWKKINAEDILNIKNVKSWTLQILILKEQIEN